MAEVVVVSVSGQEQAGRLSQDASVTVQATVTNAIDQVTTLQTSLSLDLPRTDASCTLESLAADKDVQAAVQKIHQGIDCLVLHQDSQHADVGERILEELAQLRLKPNVVAHDSSKVHVGDVINVHYPKTDDVVLLGLCLSSTPQISPANFVGRAEELQSMREILHPGEAPTEQRNLVLGGMGGVGKTQLAIAYARRYQHEYTSVLWLNATSELTLKASFRVLMRGLIKAEELEKLSEDQVLARAQEWLADTRNTKWLLIFDNYDEPEEYDLDLYYPQAGHGAIVVTTRLPDLVAGEPMRLRPLQNIEESLDILQTRSRRKGVKDDVGAHRLAERLDGLPLALVTAGAYLARNTVTFQEYLDAYNQRWQVDLRRPLRIQEYQNRTLYTTWDLSYRRLEDDDPAAAKMLKLLGYFDNQEIWYGLFQIGLSDHLPDWLQASLADQITFASLMGTLADYYLIEVQHASQSYSMHNCLHDWVFGELNQQINPQLYWYMFDCVAGSIDTDDWRLYGQFRYTRVNRHAIRLIHPRFEMSDRLGGGLLERLDTINIIAVLLAEQAQYLAAEQMYLLALFGCEEALEPNDAATLKVFNNLGALYCEQGKLNESEQMYLRALDGYEKTLGPEDSDTLQTVHNLGILYRAQGKLEEAEQMYLRALVGQERTLGPEDISTLETVHRLGVLYRTQGKVEEAEQMYLRALAGYEKGLAPEHINTLETVHNLGFLYYAEGKLNEAEQMYLRAAAGFERTLGPKHTYTLDTINHLGILYLAQGKLNEAEQMLSRALTELEKGVGPEHISTLKALHNLGVLRATEGKLDEGEQMSLRALAGCTKASGQDHLLTTTIANQLSNFRRQRDT